MPFHAAGTAPIHAVDRPSAPWLALGSSADVGAPAAAVDNGPTEIVKCASKEMWSLGQSGDGRPQWSDSMGGGSSTLVGVSRSWPACQCRTAHPEYPPCQQITAAGGESSVCVTFFFHLEDADSCTFLL